MMNETLKNEKLISDDFDNILARSARDGVDLDPDTFDRVRKTITVDNPRALWYLQKYFGFEVTKSRE